jgi:hypothetical protein
MITNDVQYRSTKAHLAKFEEALANLRAEAGTKPTKLQQLEVDAVTAQADDLRTVIEEHERSADRWTSGPLGGSATKASSPPIRRTHRASVVPHTSMSVPA